MVSSVLAEDLGQEVILDNGCCRSLIFEPEVDGWPEVGMRFNHPNHQGAPCSRKLSWGPAGLTPNLSRSQPPTTAFEGTTHDPGLLEGEAYMSD